METATTDTPTAATTAAFIPQPKPITPIDVTITPGSEYPDNLWRDAMDTINAAEAELDNARRVKRAADAAYEAAMAQRERVQVPRDQMIATDRRTPAQIGRLAGIGRARCSQIRIAMIRRQNQTEASA